MARYIIQQSRAGAVISNSKTHYVLTLLKRREGDEGEAFFWVPLPGLLGSSKNRILVTSRELYEYPRAARQLDFTQPLRFFEIGAGYSEFFVKAAGKVTVIDPVNYKTCGEMINFALERLSDPILIQRAKKLHQRHLVLTNPNKVKLINCTLGEALERHPELKGTADVLVDFCGAFWYPDSEYRKGEKFKTGQQLKKVLQARVLGLEKKLLAPDGLLLVQ